MRMGCEVYHSLKGLIKKKYGACILCPQTSDGSAGVTCGDGPRCVLCSRMTD
jgi:hypothetical protein